MRNLMAVVIIAVSMDSLVSGHNPDAERMPTTDALDEKWGILYDYSDLDNDGIYSPDDELYFAQRLIDHYHTSGDLSRGLKQYGLLYKDVIQAYFGVGTTKTALARSEYVTAHRWYWRHHFDQFEQRLCGFFTAIFHVTDSDMDGFVSFEEFQEAYKIYGDSENYEKKVGKAFELIDADGDGIITEDEFRDVYLKYILDPDITAKELPIF